MSKTKSNITIVILCLLSIFIVFPSEAIFGNTQEEENNGYIVSEYPIEEDYYSFFDEEGNIDFYSAKDVIDNSNNQNGYEIVSIDNDGNEKVIEHEAEYNDAKESAAKLEEKDIGQNLVIKEADSIVKQSRTRSVKQSEYVVKLKPITNAAGYAMYANVTNVKNKAVTGISWLSSWDAAYLRTDGDNYVIKISNITAKINKKDAELLTYSDSLAVSYYRADNGKFNHYTSTSTDKYGNYFNQIGYQPSYIENNTRYYSYDGKYFYKDYSTMLNDYRNDTVSNSVNKDAPFYNYFQYLSHRTKTNFTSDQINSYVKAITKENYAKSKLNGMGAYFTKYQNMYTTNALLMVGVAVNESGWGLSSISQSKNNLFGHGAIDSNPVYGSNGYPSPVDSIEEHSRSWVIPYSYPGDWRYNGSLLGSKSSGMNVKYATDQYWGEKASSFGYEMEGYYGNQNIDYGNYSIGIVDGDAKIYKEPNENKLLYTTGNNSYDVDDQSVVILGKVSGTSNSVWYKIASDTSLSSDRNSLNKEGTYDSSRDYAYIKSENVEVATLGNGFVSIGLNEDNGFVSGFKLGSSVADAKTILNKYPKASLVGFKNKAGQEISSGKIATGMSFTLSVNGVSKTYKVVIKGDVNGDGSILANDYFMIKKYKENSYSLSNEFLKAADVNRDGKVLANDYFMIKKYKEGQYEIAQ